MRLTRVRLCLKATAEETLTLLVQEACQAPSSRSRRACACSRCSRPSLDRTCDQHGPAGPVAKRKLGQALKIQGKRACFVQCLPKCKQPIEQSDCGILGKSMNRRGRPSKRRESSRSRPDLRRLAWAGKARARSCVRTRLIRLATGASERSGPGSPDEFRKISVRLVCCRIRSHCDLTESLPFHARISCPYLPVSGRFLALISRAQIHLASRSSQTTGRESNNRARTSQELFNAVKHLRSSQFK